MSEFDNDFSELEMADPLIDMQVNNILANVLKQLTPQIQLEPGKYTFGLKYGVGPVSRDKNGIKQRWLKVNTVVATNQDTNYAIEIEFPSEPPVTFPVTVDQ